MFNPFRFVSDAFRHEYQVRFAIERMDGGVILSLSNDEGAVVARRALSGEQLADETRLRQIVQSIRFGLAIDSGYGVSCLQAISAGQASNEPTLRGAAGGA